jgi:hypothetical protein
MPTYQPAMSQAPQGASTVIPDGQIATRPCLTVLLGRIAMIGLIVMITRTGSAGWIAMIV